MNEHTEKGMLIDDESSVNTVNGLNMNEANV